MPNMNMVRGATCDLVILEAAHLSNVLSLDSAFYAAFKAQKDTAKRRGIEFQFSFSMWLDWWLEDNRWTKRGLRGNGLVMARNGDVGPYHPDNVRCITTTENIREIDRKAQGSALKATWKAKKDLGFKSHLSTRGIGHPRSKAVLTPKGSFENASLAAEAHGLSPSRGQTLARTGSQGWSYVLH